MLPGANQYTPTKDERNWRKIAIALIDPCAGGLSVTACLRQL
jgi:hypothetical protein